MANIMYLAAMTCMRQESTAEISCENSPYEASDILLGC
jgi:hypothetical protein